MPSVPANYTGMVKGNNAAMSQKQAEIYTLGPLSMDTRQGAVDVINAYYQWMNGGSFTNL